MRRSTDDQSIKKILKQSHGLIAYKPLPEEPDFHSYSFLSNQRIQTITIPNSKDLDPFAWALKCHEIFGDQPVVVLIPGTRFDSFGTRYGRGGGWYDRFLSAIPASWTRIGVTDQAHFSKGPMERKIWDQTVDWIIVKKNGWKIYPVAKYRCQL